VQHRLALLHQRDDVTGLEPKRGPLDDPCEQEGRANPQAAGAISSPDGYGRITYSTNGVPVTLSAHRFALLLTNGELPATMVCEHGCNETLCVRVDPEHAHAGTQTANLRYAVSLGRHRGSRPGNIDPRGHYHRALAIRAALADGYDPIRLAHAREDALIATAPLFDLPSPASGAAAQTTL